MIILSDHVRYAIVQHAEATYPNECVGLLIGRIDESRIAVEDIFPAPNRWTVETGLTPTDAEHSQRDRFYLDPRDYLRADRAAELTAWTLDESAARFVAEEIVVVC